MSTCLRASCFGFPGHQLEEVKSLGVVFRYKRSNALWRMLIFFVPVFGRRFWAATRLPFQKNITIWLPDTITPGDRDRSGILGHELFHARDLRPWYGPWRMLALFLLFPLPAVFSGRWFLEREAYLHDILIGRFSVDHVVRTLAVYYAYPWPMFLMRRWFRARSCA